MEKAISFEQVKNMDLQNLGFGKLTACRLDKQGIVTLADLNGLGLKGLARIGFYGDRLQKYILDPLDKCGLGYKAILSKDERQSENFCRILNMPVTKLLSNNRIIGSYLFNNGYQKVIHLLGINKEYLSELFNAKNIDIDIVTADIERAFKDNGFIVDLDLGIFTYKKEILNENIPVTSDDVCITDVGFNKRAIHTFFRNNIYSLGDLIREQARENSAIPTFTLCVQDQIFKKIGVKNLKLDDGNQK